MKHLPDLAPNIRHDCFGLNLIIFIKPILYLGSLDYMAIASSKGGLYVIEESSPILIVQSEELHLPPLERLRVRGKICTQGPGSHALYPRLLLPPQNRSLALFTPPKSSGGRQSFPEVMHCFKTLSLHANKCK